MSRQINVRLTEPQARALLSLCGLGLAGGPEDIGYEDDREGRTMIANIERAQARLWEALAARPRTISL